MKYVNEHHAEAKALVYFTDGDCSERMEDLIEPHCPVLWAVYNNTHFTPTFGEVCEMEEE